MNGPCSRNFLRLNNPSEKESVRESYNRLAFEHHKKIKQDFINVLKESHDLVLGYFSIADVIGHLNFGNTFLMKMIYRDLDEIAEGIDSPFLVVSDHGMKPVGFFGDHSSYGFWSSGDHDLGDAQNYRLPGDYSGSFSWNIGVRNDPSFESSKRMIKKVK